MEGGGEEVYTESLACSPILVSIERKTSTAHKINAEKDGYILLLRSQMMYLSC